MKNQLILRVDHEGWICAIPACIFGGKDTFDLAKYVKVIAQVRRKYSNLPCWCREASFDL